MGEPNLVTYNISEVGFDKTEVDDDGRNAAHWLVGRTNTFLSLYLLPDLVYPPAQSELYSA
jgi:hypothetical protein